MRKLANVTVLEQNELSATQNLILDSNEFSIERPTGRMKIGDGQTKYNDLLPLDPKISGGPQLVARQILSGASMHANDSAVSSLAPTVTLGTAGAAPTIAGGIRIAPKRKSATIIDTKDDPHFEYVGAIPDRLAVSSSDCCYPDFLTGGSSQAAKNISRIRFVHTGSAFEAYYRMRTTSFVYRILVDGLPLTKDFQTITVVTSSRYYLKVDFATTETRKVTLEVMDPEFGGIVISPTDTITRQRYNAPLLAALGDSHVRGASGVAWADTWVRRASERLKLEWANLGIGGSGYLNDTGITGANYRNRILTDVVPLKPSVVLIEGTWNDRSASEPDLKIEADYCFKLLRDQLPNSLLIAIGPWVINHNLDAILDAHDVTLRASAQNNGFNGYISLRDPLNLKTSVGSWVASTAYNYGDTVVANGFVQICIAAHTSTATFDQTKFRSTGLVNGTGKAGATTGTGNADLMILADGVHGTLLAHQIKGGFIASEILRIARKVAAGEYWASN